MASVPSSSPDCATDCPDHVQDCFSEALVGPLGRTRPQGATPLQLRLAAGGCVLALLLAARKWILLGRVVPAPSCVSRDTADGPQDLGMINQNSDLQQDRRNYSVRPHFFQSSCFSLFGKTRAVFSQGQSRSPDFIVYLKLVGL